MDKTLELPQRKARAKVQKSEKIEILSQNQLIWRRFKKHKLALIGLWVLVIMYFVAILGDFFAPYAIDKRMRGLKAAPPTTIHWVSSITGLRTPFIYQVEKTVDEKTRMAIFKEKTDIEYPVQFFVHGDAYKILGFIPGNLHLFGVDKAVSINLFGTDDISRDLFSRTIIAARISLFIGLAGVFLSFFLGCIIGGISGFFGGVVDEAIQRFIEMLMSIPGLSLWMALSAAIPRNWSVEKTYFGITLVLALVGWTGLARVVRGKLLSLRDLDFVTSAKISGESDLNIIIKHLLPNFASNLIVSITLAIPGMILGETALSFIGLGMQEPGISWGVLLQDTMNLNSLSMSPWKLIPVAFIVTTVLMYNFIGDGLRDASDPYSL